MPEAEDSAGRTSRQPHPRVGPPALFAAWRRLLTRALGRADRVVADVLGAVRHASARIALGWRRLLTRLLEGFGPRASGAVRSASNPVRSAIEHLREPGTLNAEERALRTAGLVAVGVGFAVAFLLRSRQGVTSAAIDVGWGLLWVFLRLPLMRLTGRSEAVRSAVSRSWSGHLLPYVLWWVPCAGPPVVLVLSAWLAAASLLKRGVNRDEAVRVLAVAYGAQILFSAARWVGDQMALFGMFLAR